MSTGFNTQCGNGKFSIQFETDQQDKYVLMQDVARICVDGKDGRLKEIMDAERDGRCVVLPCKVGDICYEIDPGHFGVIEHTVTATTIYSKKADGKRYMEDFSNLLVIETYAVAEDGCEWTDQYTAEEWADAPKTRPEAEAALASAKQVEASAVASEVHKQGGEQDA